MCPLEAGGATLVMPIALARSVASCACCCASKRSHTETLRLGVEEAKVTVNASFIDDLGADSLDTVELVMAFEEEFGCEIPDNAAEKILTVEDAIGFIEEQSS